MPDTLLTVAEAARFFGVQRSTIYTRLATGKLQAQRVGSKTFVVIPNPTPEEPSK